MLKNQRTIGVFTGFMVGILSQAAYADINDDKLLDGLQTMKSNSENHGPQYEQRWEIICSSHINDGLFFETYFPHEGEAALKRLKEIQQAAKDKKPLSLTQEKIIHLVSTCQKDNQAFTQKENARKPVTQADIGALDQRIKVLEQSVKLLIAVGEQNKKRK